MTSIELFGDLRGLARDALDCSNQTFPQELAFLWFSAPLRDGLFACAPSRAMLANDGVRPRHERHANALDRQLSTIDETVR